MFSGTQSGWDTGVVVYSVEAGTITTNWVKANQNPIGSNKVTWQQSASAGEVTTFFAAKNSSLKNFGTGSVFVESTGSIMVISNYNLGTLGNAQAPAIKYTP
jgi:hypothetical protein